MSTKATEIHVRQQTKAVLKFLEEEKLEEARQTILKNKEILRYNFGLINFVPLIPRIRFSRRIPKANDALKMVIETGCQIYSQEDDVNELLFFAAAKCDVDNLIYCVKTILQKNPNDINQIREGDTVLMFLIKFGNIGDEKYPTCMKIVIDAGVDVNRGDYFSHNPFLFIANQYDRYSKRTIKHDVVIRNLKKCVQVLLETRNIDVSVLKTEEVTQTLIKDFPELEYYKEVNVEEQQRDTLFKFLVVNNEDDFIKAEGVKLHLDDDDGNNTLLQLCCEKNLKKAAKFLIDQGADVCKTTERNQKTPLELAARRNNPEIFDDLIQSNKIVIDQELFLIFLRGRPKHIKSRYFDEILKYKNLDLDIKSANGNTPLHYAIIFSSTDAIKILLQRGASLTAENDSKKTPLDYISPEDLENHLNRCIIPDTYNDIDNGKYELALNFKNLVETDDSGVVSELSIVQKICNSPKLCHLLNHPLISSFVNIKWKLIEPIYQKFFIFHMIFYLVTIMAFINLNLLNYFAVLLTLIYSTRIWLICNWRSNKLHEIIDITIAAIIFLSFFISNNVLRYQLGLATTMLMAFSFHLFWRFSPDFSQFHAFFVNIMTQLFSYMLYIVCLIVFFGAAFHIFFLVEHEGESTSDWQSKSPYFYLLCVFGVFIGVMIVMTIINSVTYLHQNTETVRHSFEVLGNKNTLIILQTLENLYVSRKIIKNPFIFDELSMGDCQNKKEDSSKKQKKTNKVRNRFLVNYYINTNKFSFEKLIGITLNNVNVLRIRKALNM